MLHQRVLAALLSLMLAGGALAEDMMRCATCGRDLTQAYQISGKLYCSEHVGQALPHCQNCGAEIRGDYSKVGIHGLPFCRDCSLSNPPCFLCAAPADATRGGLTLVDGRGLCATDRRTAVLSATEASEIFAEAGREVQSSLGSGMALRMPVKAVHLVGLPGLMKAGRGQYQASILASGRVLGLTTLVLKSQGARHWTEPATVYLLDGVPAQRMLTVAAHEYAHVWQAEHHANYASTTSVMREGFAEWVAYKVSQSQQRHEQMAQLSNPATDIYFNGMTRFLDLERREGVAGVLRHAVRATDI